MHIDLLKKHIIEIHSVEDVSTLFEMKVGIRPEEPLYQIELTYNSCGQIIKEKKYFSQTEWEDVQQKGYFISKR